MKSRILYSRIVISLLLLNHLTSGCQDRAVGLEHANIIPNNRFSASTEYDGRFIASNARLNGPKAWAPKSDDTNIYLQIDLDHVFVVCAVGTQGSGLGAEWVTSYKLEFSLDNQKWVVYNESGNEKVFTGNSNQDTLVKNSLSAPTMARFVRFRPLTGYNHRSMRAEVYGVRTEVCKSSLGLVNGLLPDSSLSASSGSASAGRLYGGSSWCSSSPTSNEYLQVDLGKVKTVTGIATQGDPTADKWVKTYLVKFSFDAATWIVYDGATKSKQILKGNSNKHEVVINWLSHPFKTRYVRIIPQTWNTSICLRVDVCGGLECGCETIPLGMGDWRIPNNKITVSTNSASAGRARLGTSGSWCASPSDVKPYLQVDLGTSHVICAVAIQGNPTADQWVQTYIIMTSLDGASWASYAENNNTRIFYGNYDRSSAVRQVLYKSPVARYIQIIAESIIEAVCLRVELYGYRISPECSTRSTGIPSQNMVPDHRFTATTWYDQHYLPWFGRLTLDKAWTTTSDDKNNDPYLQVDLGNMQYVCAVSTQGTPYRSNEWTAKYKLAYSKDNVTWTTYAENALEKEFAGNADRTTVVTRPISVPFMAKFVRILPTAYSSYPTLRLDYSGLQSGCASSLGIERGLVLDSQLSSSSHSDNSHTASAGRLYDGSSWCSSSSSNNEFLQVDLGKVKTVTGIATQGDPKEDNWVTQFVIRYSFTGTEWHDVTDGQDSIKIFPGNAGPRSGRVTWFSVPFAGRYIKVNPIAYQGAICMRIDLYGCGFVFAPKSQSQEALLVAARNSSVRLSCAMGFPKQLFVQWYRNGTQLAEKNSSLFTLQFSTASDAMRSYSCQRADLTKRTVNCTMLYTCAARYSLNLPSAARTQSYFTVKIQLNVLVAPSVSGVPKTRSVTLSLSVASSDDTGVLTGYTVYYKRHGGSAQTIDIGTVSQYDLNNLRPYTNYTVKARGTSVVGEGLWSAEASYGTLMAAPEGKLNITSYRADSSTSIILAWKTSNGYELNGAFKDYLIEYTAQGDSKENVAVSDISATSHLLTSLKKFTRYTITISARNTQYKGATSDSISVQTLEDAPDCSPSSPVLTAFSSTSIRVTWSALSGACVNGILRGYNISYSKNDASTPSIIDINPGLVTTDIDRLDKYSEYKVKVRGFTIKPGPYSKEEHIRTKPDYPEGVPSIIGLQAKSSTSIDMSWMFTDYNKLFGEMAGYQISYRPSNGRAVQVVNVGNVTRYTIGGLDKFTSYLVTVAVRNTLYSGPPCPAKHVQTQQDAPDAPPGSLKFTEINATTFNISWLPVPQHQLNGIIREYELDVKISSNGTSRVRKRRALTTSTYKTQANYVILYGLGSCSIYTLRVRAYTSVPTPGPYTQSLTLQTSPPDPPVALEANALSSTSIRLTWKQPPTFSVITGSYKIVAMGTKSYWASFRHQVEYTTGTSQSGHTFINLVPGTRYHFNVTSVSRCGTSRSSTVEDETYIAAPTAPMVTIISTTTNITLWTAIQYNGPINWYQIIVYRETPENKNLTDLQAKTLYDYQKAVEKDLHYYVTAELPASRMDTGRWMIVGEGDTFTGPQHEGQRQTYENVKLDESQRYKIYIRAMTYTSQKVYYSEIVMVGMVAATSKANKEPVKKDNPVAAIVAGVLAVVIILALAALFFVLYKRRLAKGSRDKKPQLQMDSIAEAAQVGGSQTTLVPEDPPRQHQGHEGPAIHEESEYDEIVHDDPYKPIPIKEFPGFVKKMRESDYLQLHDEYKGFEGSPQYSWDVARKPVNKKKNRYANIVAYDHSRVTLELVDGDEDSDYVNASFLRGFDGCTRAYIASQGPVPPAFEGFWRMIWEQNTVSIVMLTNIVEVGKTKCHQYWPEEKDMYGPVTVNCHKTEVFADYVIRTFIVSRDGAKEKRTVRQFHFTAWPDKGIPEHATSVLGFRRKVRAMTPDNAGPVVVHCSAGVGRTGAYIVVDAMLDRAKKLRNIDIHNYVVTIRKDRPHMVQTSEQYVFIHLAVLEALSCGNTEIASQNLAIALNKLEAVDKRRQLSGYFLEFQRLECVTRGERTTEDMSIGRSPENADKNRDHDIVALNRCRVILHREHVDEPDYINATFIDVHRRRNALIMTQSPMESTIEDFWRMITDYNIGTIVMLNNLQEGYQCFPQYWPLEDSVTFGDIMVEVNNTEKSTDIVCTNLQVTRGSIPRDVCHLRHLTWPDQSVPRKPQSILDLLNEVQVSQQRTGDTPVVVHCSNGVGRSGTFCAIASLIERLKEEHVIDVFQTIKRIRVNRPGAVEGLNHYVLCYQMVQRYLQSFSDYANFSDC